MKNIGACLFIAFAMLVQCQKNETKEKETFETEDLKILLNRNEYTWLTFVSAAIQLVTFIMGYEYKHTTITSNQLKPNLNKNQLYLTTQNIKEDPHYFMRLIIIGHSKAKDKNRRMLILNNTRAEEDNVFNVEFVDETINRGVNLFKGKQHSESSEVIEFPKTGFECTQEFCDEHGNGVHALGVCLPLFCACNERGAEGHKCPDSLIFDPVPGNCVNPKDAKICGFR